jgi:hypothetical protein
MQRVNMLKIYGGFWFGLEKTEGKMDEEIFNLFIPAVFTEQYIVSMGQSQQTQLYCGRMAYVY